MLASFERNVITKLDGLSGENSSLTNKNIDSGTPTITGGEKYRRVPHDLPSPNKMTLRTAMYQ